MKSIKLPASQGFVNSDATGKALLDFDMPDFGYYNLSKSYISVMVNANTTETEPASGVGVHAVYPQQFNPALYNPQSSTSNPYTNLPCRNNIFIGDYDIVSNKLGSVDNLQSSNILNVNMDIFSRDFEEMHSENYKQLCTYKDNDFVNTTQMNSMLRFLNKDKQSEEIPFELKIPLNQFSSFCNAEFYSPQDKGRLRIHHEFITSNVKYLENVAYPKGQWYYHCANAADAATTLITEAYGDIVGDGIAAADVIVVTYTNTATSYWEVKTVAGGPAFDPGNNKTTITFGPALARAAENVSFWKLNADFITTLNCNNVVNTGAADLLQNYVNLTDKQDINKLRNLIGSVVVIQGTDLTPADTYPGGPPVAGAEFDTVLVDVDYVDPYDRGNNYNGGVLVKLTLRDSFKVLANKSATNIKLWITNTKLMPAYIDTIGPVTADTPVNSLQVLQPMLPVEQMQLWVGKKVLVTCINDGVPVATKALITAISPTGLVTFNTTLFTIDDTKSATRIGIADIQAATITPVYSQPNLVLQQLDLQGNVVAKNKQLSANVYRKYSVEVATIPKDTTQYNKLYNVEPNVLNMFAIITELGNIVSNIGGLLSYRWRINNVDKTNRDIEIQSALEKDNIIQTLTNSSRPFKNMDILLADNDNTITTQLNIPMSVNIPGQYNMVQLMVNFTAAIASPYNIYLFKESEVEI